MVQRPLTFILTSVKTSNPNMYRFEKKSIHGRENTAATTRMRDVSDGLNRYAINTLAVFSFLVNKRAETPWVLSVTDWRPASSLNLQHGTTRSPLPGNLPCQLQPSFRMFLGLR